MPVLSLLLRTLASLLAWGLLALLLWNLWAFVRDVLRRSRQLHQIPCPRCRYFCDSPYLRCTVRPDLVMTEAAIHCQDFTPIAAGSKRTVVF